jgi:hypothetical protein
MKNGLFCATLVIAALLTSPAAFAGNHSNFTTERPGQACGDYIRHKHPELHGAARTAEWGKCRNDPAGYMK